MIRESLWRPMRPSTRIRRPGKMPAMRRRPSQITRIVPEPSYSSASSAGTPPRGRNVTVLSVPCTVTCSRSGASAMVTRPASSAVRRSSRASSRDWLAQRLRPRRRPPPRSPALTPALSPPLPPPLPPPFESPIRRPFDIWWKRDLKGLAGRHRRCATAHHELAQHVLPRLRRLLLDGGPTDQRRAEEPARSVDADHPRRLGGGRTAGRLHGHHAAQLGSEGTLLLVGRAAPAGGLGSDLRTHLGPEVAMA